MTVITQDDTNVKSQNTAFVHIDRKRHNSVNVKFWDADTLALANRLYTLVQAAYWETTYKPNINKTAMTVKVNKGQFAQEDIAARRVLTTFIKNNNIV